MELALAPETQRRLEDKLKQSDYGSADPLVQAALSALEQIESQGLDEETLDAIDEAEDEIERGEVHKWEDVKQKLRQLLESRRVAW